MEELEMEILESDNLTIFKPSKVMFVFLIIFNVMASVFTFIVSRTGGSVFLFGGQVSITAFTGVVSSFANICLIFMVVYYKRLGFIVALILSLAGFPIMLMGIFAQHILSIIPGLFTNMVTVLAIIFIYQRNKTIMKQRDLELDLLKASNKKTKKLFRQTATALVNAIDAKDAYSHEHSLRVAEYSMRIAQRYGLSEDECSKVYYAGLLHDVGKIGIPNSIINKKGKLTEEEYEIIKSHSEMGHQILSSISEYPFICIGAHYHHERYDGKGYPGEFSGEGIPQIARIIAVADSYDAMSSNRSYRSALPQNVVRNEIEKGRGTQFDPKFADIMLELIDEDVDYDMREKETVIPNEVAD